MKITKTTKLLKITLLFSFVMSLALYAANPLKTMETRRPQIDKLLHDQKVGALLNGMLLVTQKCNPAERKIAENENNDRKVLYKKWAKDKGKTEADIAVYFYKRYTQNYVRGINRQVEDANGTTVWWDGYLPDPRVALQKASRVLALEGARIYKFKNKSVIAKGGLSYFEAYSVVDEAYIGGMTWYKVTSEAVPRPKPVGWTPRAIGWMSDDEVVPWNQALVMKFTSPLGRSRSLFFRDSSSLEAMVKMGTDDRRLKTKSMRDPLLKPSSSLAQDPSVIGIEPILNLREMREAVIFPILDYKEVRFKSPPLPTLLLQIASKNAGKGNAANKLAVDVVFVMDTTGSTGPYIQAVLEAAEDASKTMGGNKADMKFGLVAYRDNLDYLKKEFAGDASKLSKIKLMDYSVKTVTPNLVSLKNFLGVLRNTHPVSMLTPDDVAEEVFEGVHQAAVDVKWRPRAVKLIVLIGDAPGHSADHQQSISGQDEMLLRAELVRRNIGLFAIHIVKSKSGRKYDHETKKQFMEVSRKDPQGSLVKGSGQAHYYSVDASNMRGFKNNLKGIFNEIKESIDLVVNASSSSKSRTKSSSKGSISDLIFDQASIMLSDPNAPLKDFKGWTTDDALNEPGRKALTPMILLTKDQLNQLEDSLKNIIDAGNAFKSSRKGGASSLDFFDMLQRNSGQVMKDPSAMNYKDVFGVPAGIDQLPYKSRILYLTREDFRQMGADSLNSLMFDLERMRSHYQNLLRDQDAWKELVKGSDLKDRVAGLELDMLP